MNIPALQVLSSKSEHMSSRWFRLMLKEVSRKNEKMTGSCGNYSWRCAGLWPGIDDLGEQVWVDYRFEMLYKGKVRFSFPESMLGKVQRITPKMKLFSISDVKAII